MFTAKVSKRGHYGLNTFFLKRDDLEKLLQGKDDQDVVSALSSLRVAISKFDKQQQEEEGNNVPEKWKELLLE